VVETGVCEGLRLSLANNFATNIDWNSSILIPNYLSWVDSGEAPSNTGRDAMIYELTPSTHEWWTYRCPSRITEDWIIYQL
jgi:hypothetical protein